MFNSLRTKLTVTYIVLIVVVMVLTSFFLLNILEQYYFAYQYEAMTKTATLTAEYAAPRLQSPPDVGSISNLAEDFSRQISARVIITDLRQRVLGDSVRVGGLVGTTLTRSEIASALEQEEGWTVEFSEQSKQYVLQVAVPVMSDGKVVGAVFISSSLKYIYGVLGDIRQFLLLATLLSVVLASLLGIFFAHRITVPIESLTAATEHIAHGDFTQQVQVQSKDEIGRLAAQFNDMSARMQEITRQLREFVANASHEMRTPLTSINILVKSLREYPLEPAEQEEFLEDIDQELERLIHLVESLLDLTRLDRLAAEDTLAMADVVPTILNTLQMLKKRAQDKQITLGYILPERAAPVFAVLHQIKQVVFNLVDNAIKYTPAGGKVWVSLQQDPDCLKFIVSDSGVGISAEHRDKVFERFYRIDKARSREEGGTGLGLSIVKEIIKHHGGDIWIEDGIEGVGTTFVVTLPRLILPE